MAAVPLGFALAAVKLGYYGNWGGWGWSGREIFPPKIDRTVGVKDALDQTFKDHDINYEDADKKLERGEIDKSAHRDLKNEADKQLLRDMDALDPSQMSDEAKAMRERAKGYFEREVEKYENPSIDDPIGEDADIPPAAADAWQDCQQYFPRRDPLTFDLDGDGLETVGINVNNPILYDPDSQAQGLTVGLRKSTDPEGQYKSPDNSITYQLNGADLTIQTPTGTLTVKDFNKDTQDLGLRLVKQETLIPQPAFTGSGNDDIDYLPQHQDCSMNNMFCNLQNICCNETLSYAALPLAA